MPLVTITNDDGQETGRYRVRSEVTPELLGFVVAKAINEIPAPRKPRCDIGTQRGPRKQETKPAILTS